MVYLLKIDENKEKQRYNHILKKQFFFLLRNSILRDFIGIPKEHSQRIKLH